MRELYSNKVIQKKTNNMTDHTIEVDERKNTRLTNACMWPSSAELMIIRDKTYTNTDQIEQFHCHQLSPITKTSTASNSMKCLHIDWKRIECVKLDDRDPVDENENQNKYGHTILCSSDIK